jgi:hypothetical protein
MRRSRWILIGLRLSLSVASTVLSSVSASGACPDPRLLRDVADFLAPGWEGQISAQTSLQHDSGFLRLLKNIEKRPLGQVLSMDRDRKTGLNAYDKHILSTRDDLFERMQRNPGLEGASRFKSEETARRALLELPKQIDRLFGGVEGEVSPVLAKHIFFPDNPQSDRLRLTYELDYPVGTGLRRLRKGKVEEISDINRVTVILTRHQKKDGDISYSVYTAYPETRVTP